MDARAVLGYEKAASRNWSWAGERRQPDARQFSTTGLRLLDLGIANTLSREAHQLRRARRQSFVPFGKTRKIVSKRFH